MDSKDFSNISLVGRVAFGINCFEKALLFLKCDINKWKPVLKDLWTFMSVDFLDDWSGLMAEILPENILEFKDYNDDYEYINEEKFIYLRTLYDDIDDRLHVLMDCIFRLGESHAYSVIIDGGSESLVNLQRLIDFMLKSSLPLPDVQKYEKFSINDNKGWGNRIDGGTLSIIPGSSGFIVDGWEK
jgi:hypothetical protein